MGATGLHKRSAEDWGDRSRLLVSILDATGEIPPVFHGLLHKGAKGEVIRFEGPSVKRRPKAPDRECRCAITNSGQALLK